MIIITVIQPYKFDYENVVNLRTYIQSLNAFADASNAKFQEWQVSQYYLKKDSHR